MKKFVMTGLFIASLAGGGLIGQIEASAESKYCTATSIWSSCYNTARDDAADYQVQRQDVSRATSASKLQFSSSYYDTSTFGPNYGSGSFFQGHWIYDKVTGNLYDNTSINLKYINGSDFYISNTSNSLNYSGGVLCNEKVQSCAVY
ncbi:hypothetical protein [Ectobacillus antri]|jgi:hypothetical protein|uniref:hypothetical protein n=1 Tax=Ectobacillus antri TaxID=2486280 RepID=UPI000F5B13C1|nr:hypothetical protein [Ectobacillus antri]